MAETALRTAGTVAAEDISVVVCTSRLKRRHLLEAAVASVRAQVRGPREIVVVVDSNPALQRFAERALAGARVVASSGSGLSAARNTGVAATAGSVIAFIDDDARAEPDWLLRLAALYREDVLGVGGDVRPSWRARAPAWLPQEFYWAVGCSYRGLPAQAAEVRNPIGCNMSLRREMFAAAGGFRSGLGRVADGAQGCEETELCVRWAQARPAGRFLYEPAAVVHHVVGTERARWSYFLRRCYAEGRSKAVVSRLWGAPALGAERRHAFDVLPRALRHELADLARRRDSAAGARAAAIVLGAAATAAGYLRAWAPAAA